MAEVVIPEIKHEYIRQVDTKTTKDDWFDECIADNKEAAWAGIGTSENDSQYQPAPSVEPDYYMQYCSSDDYDYLKDYRLIWGYGIGIIEQDVICSLITGEHLAEGKDACDTYATENAAGENTDWKRGTWIKFSGNRNVSPTRIGEVVLPERIISLKDLCVALNLDSVSECDFYLPIETNDSVLNINNLCGQKSQIKVLRNSQGAWEHFQGALQCGYAFAYANTAEAIQIGWSNAVDCNHMFYHSTIGNMNTFSENETCDYTSMFEEATGDNLELSPYYIDKAMFKNSHGISVNTSGVIYCKQDVSECFYGCDIYYDITGIDFSEARKVQYMFYDINLINIDEIDLDLSSFAEHDDDVEDRFNDFLNNNTSNTIINIISPNIKIKGNRVFGTDGNFNIINKLIYKDIWDLPIINCPNGHNNDKRTGLFIRAIEITGHIQGVDIFNFYSLENSFDFGVGSKISTAPKPDNISVEDVIEFYLNNNYIFPHAFNYYEFKGILPNSKLDNINFDDYYFVDAIVSYMYLDNRISSGHINNNITININKENKDFGLVSNLPYGRNFNISVNNNSNIVITESNLSVEYNEERYEYNINGKYDYINIINNDNNAYNLINVYASKNKISRCVIYNFPTCELSMIGNKLYPYNSSYTFNINNLYKFTVNNLKVESEYNNGSVRAYIKNINIFQNDYENNYVIRTDERFIGDSLITIYTNNINKITSSLTINNKGYIPLSSILKYEENGENLNYPIIETNTEEYDYNGTIGEFKNTPLTELNKRYYNTYNNKRKRYAISLYYNGESWINNDSDFNFDYSNKVPLQFSLNGDFINKTITLKGQTNGSYIGYTANNKISNATFILLDRPFTFYNLSKTINIELRKNTKYSGDLIFYSCPTVLNIELGNGFDNGFGISINYDFIDNVDTEEFYITNNNGNGKISKDLNLYLFDKLSQNSINSLVNPNIYDSGITLTINTIPFQYITEEQKQALVNAGVTLVEYIPTETTE